MPVAIKGTGGGSVTLDAGSAAADSTLTLPNTSGTVATTAGTLTNPTINGFTGNTSVINVGSGQFYKDTSGNVGIGTSSPIGRLDLSIPSAGRLVFTNSGSANYITSLNSGLTGSQDLVINGNNVYFNSGGSTKASIDTNGTFYFNSGYGSAAVAYGCRAWVQFDGTTSPGTINGSANVSSVTRPATGTYTISFTTAMPDANYSAVGSCVGDGNGNGRGPVEISGPTRPTTAAVQVITCAAQNVSSPRNSPLVCVAVFR
jgi:hypothetical protein